MPLLTVLALGVGCATEQPEPTYESVPAASNIDPSLGQLATTTGMKVYAEKEKPKEKPAKPDPKKAEPVTKPAAAIVVPDVSRSGTVMTYNQAGRFVVLNYPLGSMPAIGERVFIYRNGLKTGEAKVTGPRRDDNIVADLLTGEATQGDEARSK